MTTPSRETIDIKDLLSILQRQVRLIGITIFVFLTIAFLFLARAVPLYTATALIEVDPAGRSLLDPQDAQRAAATMADARLESEVEKLRSSSLALDTIRDTELYLTDEFGVSLSLTDRAKQAIGLELPEPPTGLLVVQATLGRFNDAMSVRRRGLTYLVAVSFTSEHPTRAAEVANAHAETYIRRQLDAKVQDALAGRDILRAQLDLAQTQLAATDGAFSDYIDRNLDRLMAESGSMAVENLRDQMTAAAATRVDLLQAQTRARAALEASDFDGLVNEIGDATLIALTEQRSVLARQIAGSTEGAAEAIDLAAGLADLEARIATEGARAVSQLDASVTGYETAEADLRAQLQTELLSSPLSPQALTEVYSLQQEAQIAQRQYDTMLLRLREIETQALVQIADSRVVSEALPPHQPSYPNKKLILALALFAGIGGGITLAFAYEYFVGGVTSAIQLGNLLPARVGAVIPRETLPADQKTVADKVVNEPMSLIAESFRRLRAAVDRACPDDPGKGKVIMVCSSVPAEGKSTTALALARTYAAAGKKTLLIDADLRNPSQHSFIDCEPKHGILDYLLDEVDGDEAFYDADPKSSLGVMMGRRRSMVPTDAPLQSTTFRDLISNARGALDVIIIDTAPLVPVVDARYIAPLADCAVLCVRHGITKQTELRTCFDQLTDSLRSDAEVVTVLNCYEGREKSYRYDGYYGYAGK
ncbi:MAG: AAA family ATPase [Marivivens sp.]|uniref:GumC family protein n=1 Tax=Marivivens sp. TaxID=1978374 RepID=UPI00183E0A66|nr:GNVR domain-containing protein [Marivivens sp.]NVJ95943.1 AAA family ATPase [Marivivens sp.]